MRESLFGVIEGLLGCQARMDRSLVVTVRNREAQASGLQRIYQQGKVEPDRGSVSETLDDGGRQCFI